MDYCYQSPLQQCECLSIHVSLPQSLNTDQCENITSFGDGFILLLSTARAVAAIVKKSSITVNPNLGQCNPSLAYWTPEFGSHDIAAKNYNWVRMTNLSLHCWNWNLIVEVLRPLGDLIFVQKREDISLEHLRALVSLQAQVNFPLEIIIDVGIRSFKVRLEDDRIPVL